MALTADSRKSTSLLDIKLNWLLGEGGPYLSQAPRRNCLGFALVIAATYAVTSFASWRPWTVMDGCGWMVGLFRPTAGSSWEAGYGVGLYGKQHGRMSQSPKAFGKLSKVDHGILGDASCRCAWRELCCRVIKQMFRASGWEIWRRTCISAGRRAAMLGAAAGVLGQAQQAQAFGKDPSDWLGYYKDLAGNHQGMALMMRCLRGP